jgi:hypothetical protein
VVSSNPAHQTQINQNGSKWAGEISPFPFRRALTTLARGVLSRCNVAQFLFVNFVYFDSCILSRNGVL